MNSSLYSCETYKQEKEMVILHLFIEHHYKYIVSIIRERHVLTLHLSTANWRIKLTTGCCCKNVAAVYCTCYAIYFCLVELIPQLLELWPISMHFHGPSSFTLLYRNATTYGISWSWQILFSILYEHDHLICIYVISGTYVFISGLGKFRQDKVAPLFPTNERYVILVGCRMYQVYSYK